METGKNSFTSEKQEWQANLLGRLDLIGTEIGFIQKLLSASVFKEHVPNLFERITTYLNKNEAFKAVFDEIAREFRTLKESPDAKEATGPLWEIWNVKFTEFVSEFSDFKTELYNYAGGNFKE